MIYFQALLALMHIRCGEQDSRCDAMLHLNIDGSEMEMASLRLAAQGGSSRLGLRDLHETRVMTNAWPAVCSKFILSALLAQAHSRDAAM